MALSFFDRVKAGVTGTPGTGTITLASAVSGFQSFATAGVPNGASIPYVIEDGTAWEVGHGTYTSAGTTLSRDTVLGSSAGGTTKISATSAAVVYISALANEVGGFAAQGEVGPFSPPLAASLTPDAPSTVTDYAGRGLSFKSAWITSALYKAVKTKPSGTTWTITARIKPSAGTYLSFPIAGLLVFDNTQNRGVWLGRVGATNGSPSGVASVGGSKVQHTTSGLAFSANLADAETDADMCWYRIAADGTSLYFLNSGDGISWSQIFTETIATWVATMSHVGLILGATSGIKPSGSANTLEMTRDFGLLCTYYKEEATANFTGVAT